MNELQSQDTWKEEEEEKSERRDRSRQEITAVMLLDSRGISCLSCLHSGLTRLLDPRVPRRKAGVCVWMYVCECECEDQDDGGNKIGGVKREGEDGGWRCLAGNFAREAAKRSSGRQTDRQTVRHIHSHTGGSIKQQPLQQGKSRRERDRMEEQERSGIRGEREIERGKRGKS